MKIEFKLKLIKEINLTTHLDSFKENHEHQNNRMINVSIISIRIFLLDWQRKKVIEDIVWSFCIDRVCRVLLKNLQY